MGVSGDIQKMQQLCLCEMVSLWTLTQMFFFQIISFLILITCNLTAGTEKQRERERTGHTAGDKESCTHWLHGNVVMRVRLLIKAECFGEDYSIWLLSITESNHTPGSHEWGRCLLAECKGTFSASSGPAAPPWLFLTTLELKKKKNLKAFVHQCKQLLFLKIHCNIVYKLLLLLLLFFLSVSWCYWHVVALLTGLHAADWVKVFFYII